MQDPLFINRRLSFVNVFRSSVMRAASVAFGRGVYPPVARYVFVVSILFLISVYLFDVFVILARYVVKCR